MIVDLAIDAEKRLYWNNEPVSEDDLQSLFAQQAALDLQPLIRIRADADMCYGLLAKIMALARRAGVKRLGAL